jgi:hypothetical protein
MQKLTSPGGSPEQVVQEASPAADKNKQFQLVRLQNLKYICHYIAYKLQLNS